MEKFQIFDIVIFIILIFTYVFIEDSDFYIKLIYVFLIIYHVYISILVIFENISISTIKIKLFIIVSIILYLFTYFIIFDTNPFFFIFVYYLFFPYLWKGVLIVFIHSYILSKFIKINNNYKPIENNSDFTEDISLKEKNSISTSSIMSNPSISSYYFLFGFFCFIIKTKKRFFIFFICLILIIMLDIKIFINRNKLWVLFNKKSKILPKMTSSNTTFYITATLVNIIFSL